MGLDADANNDLVFENVLELELVDMQNNTRPMLRPNRLKLD